MLLHTFRAKHTITSTSGSINGKIIMKTTILMVFLLPACYLSADAWGSGRNSFDVWAHANNNYGRLTGEYRHHRDNWSFGVGGSIDTNGNWGVHTGVTFRWKRSAGLSGNHYNITLKIDPCNFYTYDGDRDGAMEIEELQVIFGNNEKTDALFADLDTATGDGVILKEEFYAAAPVFITEYMDTADHY